MSERKHEENISGGISNATQIFSGSDEVDQESECLLNKFSQGEEGKHATNDHTLIVLGAPRYLVRGQRSHNLREANGISKETRRRVSFISLTRTDDNRTRISAARRKESNAKAHSKKFEVTGLDGEIPLSLEE